MCKSRVPLMRILCKLGFNPYAWGSWWLMSDPVAIFTSEIIRVRTMADGSPRFELGAGEDANIFLTTLAQVQAGKRLVKVIIYDLDDWERLEAEHK